jgi:hypothetical protein
MARKRVYQRFDFQPLWVLERPSASDYVATLDIDAALYKEWAALQDRLLVLERLIADSEVKIDD